MSQSTKLVSYCQKPSNVVGKVGYLCDMCCSEIDEWLELDTTSEIVHICLNCAGTISTYYLENKEEKTQEDRPEITAETHADSIYD